MKRKVIKKILIGLFVVLVVLQFIRPSVNDGAVETATDFTRYMSVPDTVKSIFRQSCYDCHSNHTNYPWYSKISPASLWLARHIRNGKKELNFSDFSRYNARRIRSKLSSIAEQVENREMPLRSYLAVHRDAKLTEGQIALIKEWVDESKKTIK